MHETAWFHWYQPSIVLAPFVISHSTLTDGHSHPWEHCVLEDLGHLDQVLALILKVKLHVLPELWTDLDHLGNSAMGCHFVVHAFTSALECHLAYFSRFFLESGVNVFDLKEHLLADVLEQIAGICDFWDLWDICFLDREFKLLLVEISLWEVLGLLENGVFWIVQSVVEKGI